MQSKTYHIEIESIAPYPKRLWQEILQGFLSLLEKQKNFSFDNCTLTLLVIKDNDMIYHNREQMGVHGPTNILSFPEEDSTAVFLQKTQNIPCIKKRRTHLGTLVLSIDTLLREAFLYGQEAHIHAIRLLAHGLAHLLGYDHGDDMWELTDFLEENFQKQPLSSILTPIWSFKHD